MANLGTHLLVGAAAGTLPDFFLLFFGWRTTWLQDDHILIRCHAFLHSYKGLLLALALGYLTHIYIDKATH